MKTQLILILFLFPIQLLSQHQPIESTSQRDLIYLSERYDNDLYYYNMNKFILEPGGWESTVEISGNLAYFDFSNMSITKTMIYSKADSINYIISIVKDNYNTLYTIRTLRNSATDLSPSFFLEKRTDDMSEVTETIQLNISTNVDRVINAFFDDNDVLQFKGIQKDPNLQSFHYSIDIGNVTNGFTTVVGLDNFYFHDINDSTYISYLHANEQVIYHKKDAFDITKTVELRNNGHYINEKSELFENYLFLNGEINQGVWNQPNRHIVYKHEIESDTAIAIFIDSLSQEEPHYAFNSIDLIDTNFIYTGSNFGFCPVLPIDYSCISSFKIYCITSIGELKWSKTIGGNANNWLHHIYATPDSGCLVLYYRHAEIDSASNGNMYWLKYDKFGNEESDYLSEFYLEVEENEAKLENVILFPNPTNGSINFSGLPENQFSHLKIYNALGQLVYNKTIIDNKIKISNLTNGTYFYQIYNDIEILKNGKLIKN